MRHIFYPLAVFLMLSACSPQVPGTTQSVKNTPSIFPDYTDVTVPTNIAPLNFKIEEQGQKYVTLITSGSP